MDENAFVNGKEQIKESIRYWKEYWIYYASQLCNSNDYNVTINSPHSLIDNIISEIEYNNLKNKENRALFRKQLGEWKKNERVFSSLFGDKVNLLLARFDDSSCIQYLLQICRQIKDALIKGEYLDALLNHLAGIINDSTLLNYEHKNKINKYTELIIVEFIINGIVAEDLTNIIIDIEALELADFKINDYKSEEEYHKAINEYLENKTIYQEINVVQKYYKKKSEQCFVLARLEGIKGEIDIYIDDINIYSPYLKQYIVERKHSCDIEKISDERKFVNVAIPVEYRMLHSSYAYAINKLESILDILELTYNNSKPIKYDKHRLCIIDKKGDVKAGYFSIDELEYDENDYIVSETSALEVPKSPKCVLDYEVHRDYLLSLDISDKKDDFELIEERVITLRNSSKLSRAAHWYQKGKNTESLEDKLLFHWIAIESLLRSSDKTYHNIIIGEEEVSLLNVIQRISLSVMLCKLFEKYYIDIYNSLFILTKHYDNYLKISVDLQSRIFPQNNDGKDYEKYLCNFLNSLEELEENINNQLYKSKISSLREHFLSYQDDKKMKAKELDFSNDILLIYRLRNLIVHNAIFPKYSIKYYANKVEIISGSIIKSLIEKNRKTNWSIDDILIDISIKYEDFKSNINEKIRKLKQYQHNITGY